MIFQIFLSFDLTPNPSPQGEGDSSSHVQNCKHICKCVNYNYLYLRKFYTLVDINNMMFNLINSY